MSGAAVPTLTADRLWMTWLGEGRPAVGLAWAVGRVKGAWDFLGEGEGEAPPALPPLGLNAQHPIFKIPFDNTRTVRMTHLAKQ